MSSEDKRLAAVRSLWPDLPQFFGPRLTREDWRLLALLPFKDGAATGRGAKPAPAVSQDMSLIELNPTHFGQPGDETDLPYIAGLLALCVGGDARGPEDHDANADTSCVPNLSL